MIIQMVYQMSGGRYDDRSWPLPWTNFEVPDEEGRGLVRCGAAMELVQVTPPAPEPAPSKPAPPTPSKPVTAPLPVVVREQQAEVVPEEPPAPAASASRQAWVDYAVSQGASRVEASDSTKAQLQAAYGGRL